MAIKKAVAALDVLKRAEERLNQKPQPWAADIVSTGRKALSMLQGLEDIASKRSPTETQEAHALRVSKAAERMLGQVEALRQKVHDTRTAAGRSLAEQIQARVKLNDGPRGAEIRGLFRTLSSEDRQRIMDEAIASNDHETLGALFNAPAYLAGLDGKYQEQMKHSYERQVAPELHEALDEVLAADSTIAIVHKVATDAATEALKPDYVSKVLKEQAEAERAQAGFDGALAD